MKGEAYFGQGEDPIFLDDIRCSLDDLDAVFCRHGGWGDHNCNHGEDVGIICQPN